MSDLLQSRKFWIALIAFLVIIAQVVFPTFQLNAEELAGLCIVVAAYMIGVAVDPGDPKAKVSGMLKSRKFWGAVIGIVVIVVAGFGKTLPFDFSADQLISICAVLGGYISGVALEGKYQNEVKQIVDAAKNIK